jgi:hypothetical protein
MRSLIVLWLLASPALFGQSPSYTTLDRDVIEGRLKRYGKNNAERKAALVQLFGEAGCAEGCLTEQPVPKIPQPNVVCTLPGKSDSVIVVGAHFDMVDVGKGVVDNWSGAALLVSLYESVKSEPRSHTFVFVGFTAEEAGLIGSEHYVRQLSDKNAARIRAMVNMDSLGLSSTKLWLSHADKELAFLFAMASGASNLPLQPVDVDKVGTSDSESFARRKIPALTVHSVTQETYPILHSPRDRIDAIHLSDYYDTYRLLALYLAYLDAKLPS